VFADNLKTIEELNRLNPQATFAVNKFADRTKQEMKAFRGLSVVPKDISTETVSDISDAKDSDWIAYWSKVKDQGQCGSCWAFSATATVEARYHLSQSKKTVETFFAEQQLVDCDKQSEGCNGGLMDYAFDYLKTHAFCDEKSYKYTARDGKCKDTTCKGPKVKSYTDIKDEAKLLDELVHGPVAVAVDAETWSFYSGGILSNCGKDLDHGVTLVKYNSKEKSVTIRNSWGAGWGEKGHIRLAGGKNTCGYASDASYPAF